MLKIIIFLHLLEQPDCYEPNTINCTRISTHAECMQRSPRGSIIVIKNIVRFKFLTSVSKGIQNYIFYIQFNVLCCWQMVFGLSLSLSMFRINYAKSQNHLFCKHKKGSDSNEQEKLFQIGKMENQGQMEVLEGSKCQHCEQ